MLESSKGFAKRFLQRHAIPTAGYAICSSPVELQDAIDRFHPPIVVKADGLAAGKGVIICESRIRHSKPRQRCSPARSSAPKSSR